MVDASRPLWSHIRQRIPFLHTTNNNQQQRHHHTESSYTPLIFFTVPKGLSPVCDEMEQIVRQIEKECHVRVERLDVLRHPENEAVLTMVTNSIRTATPTPTATSSNPSTMIQPQPPLLYHRESRQVYQVCAPPTTSSSTKATASSTPTLPPYIDKERIRAWAKGRYLSPFIGGRWTNVDAAIPHTKSSTPVVNHDDDDGIDPHMEALLDEMALSPEQLKGKRLMEERTRAKTATVTSK